MKSYFVIALSMYISAGCFAQKEIKINAALEKTFTQNFKEADAQYKLMMQKLPDGRFPKTFEKDTLRTSDSEWWCSGFYPGSLLYIFEETNDSALYRESIRMLGLLEKEQYNTSTHDLGFM